MMTAHQGINLSFCIECKKRPSINLGEGDDNLYCLHCHHQMLDDMVRRSKEPCFLIDYKRPPGKRQKKQQANKKQLKKSLRKNWEKR